MKHIKLLNDINDPLFKSFVKLRRKISIQKAINKLNFSYEYQYDKNGNIKIVKVFKGERFIKSKQANQISKGKKNEKH